MTFDIRLADCSDETSPRDTYQLEMVDHAHPDWPAVLEAITAAGQRHVLRVGEGGWLSARQCVAAAISEGEVVGYTIFHVELFRSSNGVMRLQPGGLAMQAIIDVTTTSIGHWAVAGPLVELAKSHAQSTLSCVEFDQQWLAA